MDIPTETTQKGIGKVESCPGVYLWNSPNTRPYTTQNTGTLAQRIGKNGLENLPIPR